MSAFNELHGLFAHFPPPNRRLYFRAETVTFSPSDRLVRILSFSFKNDNFCEEEEGVEGVDDILAQEMIEESPTNRMRISYEREGRTINLVQWREEGILSQQKMDLV